VDHIEYLKMKPVIMLPVNSHELISLYLLYRHTCCILGKDYSSLYKQWHVDMCGRLENFWFVFDWPTWRTSAQLTWWLH